MEKVYIVTLKNRDDLEDFYAEMSSKGFKLHMKRKISRNWRRIFRNISSWSFCKTLGL